MYISVFGILIFFVGQDYTAQDLVDESWNQVITWTHVDKDMGHHMVSLGHGNPLRPSDASMSQETNPSLIQMFRRLVGAKPLSEPMLEYC